MLVNWVQGLKRKREVKDNSQVLVGEKWKNEVSIYLVGDDIRRSRYRNEQKLIWGHVKFETHIRHLRGAVK